MAASKDAAKVITTANAGSCSAFELRQELNRRGAFDLEEDKVNFRSLLQRLMIELVKDEEKASQDRLKAMEDDAAAKREEAKRERERKKAEALERSKQRQADPSYLEARKAANEERRGAASVHEETHPSGTTSSEEEKRKEEKEEEEEEENEDGQDGPDDPFRSYKPKGRNKVFVR